MFRRKACADPVAGRTMADPRSQLNAIDPDESTHEAINDWHYWMAQGLRLFSFGSDAGGFGPPPIRINLLQSLAQVAGINNGMVVQGFVVAGQIAHFLEERFQLL